MGGRREGGGLWVTGWNAETERVGTHHALHPEGRCDGRPRVGRRELLVVIVGTGAAVLSHQPETVGRRGAALASRLTLMHVRHLSKAAKRTPTQPACVAIVA